MKNLIYGFLASVPLWVTLPFLGIKTTFFIPILIEWATKFILPWILLYWIIRLVKGLEKNK
ncbi:hypothetical protein PB01_15360 [Psychrobacillus glaciei]|uniref:Uncharacterized protein n=1 Tax=Psychrobacillus glaciei TaxID=2283160 RepID=A0A5J6SQ87_9BACI|nr:hypothetical protein [Psychrobacillus glaciei]QFG00091.1 hypothetical protein PB01_15360 [Psychrobacillus glaciei]